MSEYRVTEQKKATISAVTVIAILAVALLLLTQNVYGNQDAAERLPALENVRAYAPAVTPGGDGYAVDGGLLYAGEPGRWRLVETPDDLIVNAVAVDSRRPEILVIGAADRSLLYISRDGGESWQAAPLESGTPSGVTALAIDGANRIIYAGTFTNGVYRLRDVGSSVIAAGHLLLDEPVAQVVADSSGTGMAFVRTRWNLYRAEESGLRWFPVEGLPSPATAVAIAGAPATVPATAPAIVPVTVYVGTARSGILKSMNGIVWESANEGLPYTPGSQLYISALATDPLQPNLIYAASNLIFGSANAHVTPVDLAISTDSGSRWQPLPGQVETVLTDLMAISGQTGVVYALSERSRTPLALDNAPQPVVIQPDLGPGPERTPGPMDPLRTVAWIVASLATAVLALLVGWDIYQGIRRRRGGLPVKRLGLSQRRQAVRSRWQPAVYLYRQR